MIISYYSRELFFQPALLTLTCYFVINNEYSASATFFIQAVAASKTTTTSLSSQQVVDWDAFDAIKSLHTRLDHDNDGQVDSTESEKFLERDKNGQYKRDVLWKDDDDGRLSVSELWEAWKRSLPHNWTIDETINWLVYCVELPEYSQIFEQNFINGTLLPRLATDPHFISKLGITEPRAVSKISIKAMDVVLFGPPKNVNNNKIREILLSIIIVMAIPTCYVFYSRSQTSQRALQAMQHHVESLQKAEDHMSSLQEELNEAKKAKLEMERQFVAPPTLRDLLKRTYNIESQYYNEKKLNLENKATEVKMRNQKLQKKKTSFLGYYKMAQENSLEEDINTIVEVKEAIMQVTKDIKERTERWRAIEEFCGCSLDLKHSDSREKF